MQFAGIFDSKRKEETNVEGSFFERGPVFGPARAVHEQQSSGDV